MLNQILRVSLLGVLCGPLVAQTDTARIVGTVTDATGAVISAASVTVLNEKTGQSLKITANEQGHFLATPLMPNVYSMTVEAPGMAKSEFKGINLQIGQERTIDVAMSPAAISSEVNVSGGALAVVDVSSARIGANISEREVAELPMNGRQISQLYLLA